MKAALKLFFLLLLLLLSVFVVVVVVVVVWGVGAGCVRVICSCFLFHIYVKRETLRECVSITSMYCHPSPTKPAALMKVGD